MSTGIDLLYCDNHLLAVDKPAGLPTVPDASGDASLLDACRTYVKERYGKPGAVYLGVVHRLDRPVSGVVVFARTSKAAARLTAAFRDRRAAKTYWGVVARDPGAESGALEQWLVKDRDRNRVHVVRAGSADARHAVTEWRVLERGRPGRLVELIPRTGRPHQLRVAMASLHAPLLGDLKYGAPTPLADASIALHACVLVIDHPTRDERLRLESPPPLTAAFGFDACEVARGVGRRAVLIDRDGRERRA
ncbi:MAG: RluA family pseudouridine synthase [Planctomycetota bacterium]|nr:MAG: RluA family pseudouridine synthase [Planctomycetota bacterium]